MKSARFGRTAGVASVLLATLAMPQLPSTTALAQTTIKVGVAQRVFVLEVPVGGGESVRFAASQYCAA